MGAARIGLVTVLAWFCAQSAAAAEKEALPERSRWNGVMRISAPAKAPDAAGKKKGKKKGGGKKKAKAAQAEKGAEENGHWSAIFTVTDRDKDRFITELWVKDRVVDGGRRGVRLEGTISKNHLRAKVTGFLGAAGKQRWGTEGIIDTLWEGAIKDDDRLTLRTTHQNGAVRTVEASLDE